VVGRGQVAVSVPGPRPTAPIEKLNDKVSQATAPVALAANDSVSRKAE
jgi:hypothetical protein